MAKQEKMSVAEYRAYIASPNAKISTSPAKGKKPNGLSFSQSCLHIELRRYLETKYGEVIAEYKFHPERKWRFDYFIPSIQTGVEIEGIDSGWSGKSRHLTPNGYQGDIEKYNTAKSLNLIYYQFTYNDLRKLRYQLYL